MNEQRRVLKCRDFSAGRARELLLQRGITNGQLARAINCHPKSIAAIVNGRVEYRRGRLYERLRRHLISNRCADVVQQIDMVTMLRFFPLTALKKLRLCISSANKELARKKIEYTHH